MLMSTDIRGQSFSAHTLSTALQSHSRGCRLSVVEGLTGAQLQDLMIK